MHQLGSWGRYLCDAMKLMEILKFGVYGFQRNVMHFIDVI